MSGKRTDYLTWDEYFMGEMCIRDRCTDRADTYFILKDFRSYAEAQKRVEEAYRDQQRWSRMAMMNTICSGKFSSDRTIEEYVSDIWKLEKVDVAPLEE